MYYFGLLCNTVFYSSKLFYKYFFNDAQILKFIV